MSTQVDKAQSLARLHAAPEILRLVNVWDAVSARTVAALPETRAIATAGHPRRDDLGVAPASDMDWSPCVAPTVRRQLPAAIGSG